MINFRHCRDLANRQQTTNNRQNRLLYLHVHGVIIMAYHNVFDRGLITRVTMHRRMTSWATSKPHCPI